MKLFQALRVRSKDVVALVGGGGKTSAMFRLGDELAAQGWRVAVTTSTHIGADQIGLAHHVIIQPPNQLTAQLLTHSPTLLVGSINPQTNKAIGLEPDVIDRIIPLLGVDVVLNEADGARMLPFKAPAEHEPVITPGTTLIVPVVGVDAIGGTLDAAHVHRPERVAALAGAKLGQPVTPEIVTAVLAHPQGGLKGVPPGARVVALVNKVHTNAQLKTAQHLADLLLDAPRIEAIAIGAIKEADPVRLVKSRVAAVVLAAGESRRFGRLKQLLPWGEGTLLSHAVDVALASGARPVVVVLGCQAEACRTALGSRPVSIVVNPDWAQGQSTSVQVGLAALPENVGGVVFHLVDMPYATPVVIDALIARHATTLAPVVWPEHQGKRGNPVLFNRVTFPEFQKLRGDVGAKPILMAHARAGSAERVAVDEPGVLLDIDTPQDLSQPST